jgi:outer membrane lipoprotein-sorting protein
MRLPAFQSRQGKQLGTTGSLTAMLKSRLYATTLVLVGTLATWIIIAGPGVERVSAAQAKPSRLTTVLDEMDAASTKFQSAQADLRQEIFTKVMQDTETKTGQIYFERKNGATQMGMKLLPPDAKPGTPPAQIVEFKDGKLRVWDTGTNQVDQFAASGKNQSIAETLMTLGFGGSGSSLAKAFLVTDQGTEQMSEGSKSVSVEKLDLVPRDAGIKNNYSHITIWVDPVRDVSLKQTLFEASGGQSTGDTRTVVYTNIRLNQKVDEAPFTILCKAKCNVVSH